MGYFTNISELGKGRIVNLWEQRLPISQIADQLNVSRPTTVRLCEESLGSSKKKCHISDEKTFQSNQHGRKILWREREQYKIRASECVSIFKKNRIDQDVKVALLFSDDVGAIAFVYTVVNTVTNTATLTPPTPLTTPALTTISASTSTSTTTSSFGDDDDGYLSPPPSSADSTDEERCKCGACLARHTINVFI